MRERRLLERIASWGAGGARSNETQVDVLVDSVMNHLGRLLNTRQGSVQIDPQFGVPDFTNLAGTTAMGSTREIEEEIRRMVLRYEPRIKSPRVTLNREETDVLSIRFALEGTLEVDDREIPLRISTTVGANGRVSVG
ncbi:type VI secretion system baseplate subunit TssE (plasmid) [Caballeronia sp. NK8]|uniref:type VI secretion system baseplate subunit TssE n=1 Tax=Caballeronia sp. NK8 TaxID=140098 RepID=UPI001BB4E9FC|nr:type VI secretion system baseplate subunit TssE [Caballeronia sp. NK8]BCQ28333.1 type VI secretion system baseplate subunit TssE [Caballeronia sp. NK8]